MKAWVQGYGNVCLNNVNDSSFDFKNIIHFYYASLYSLSDMRALLFHSRIQTPVRKAPSEPPSSSQRRSRPPVHPDASKKRSLKSSPAHESKKDRGGGAYEDSQDQHDLGIDRRMSTPQEVLE